MAKRPRLFAAGILYHVIVRGNYRQKTFRDDRDYEAYLARLARYRKRFGVTVYAYCLMSNHVHLLLETGTEPLSHRTYSPLPHGSFDRDHSFGQ